MKLRMVVGACAVLLAAMVWVHAAETPSADAKTEKKSTGRLTQPWSKISSLNDDQKDKIKAIHSKALDEIKVIHEKENTDIMALLNDDQKKEAEKLMGEMKSKASAAAEKKPAEEKKE